MRYQIRGFVFDTLEEAQQKCRLIARKYFDHPSGGGEYDREKEEYETMVEMLVASIEEIEE
ncbi:MAG TPA: hypothetical protein VMD05_07950 [Candidatus Nanoarchaeia archaeon]|nr:hypothetical protein [Candidatus Nanoarchaeia archaeon]